MHTTQPAGPGIDAFGVDRGTREAVVRRLFERGALTASDLAADLGISPAAVRRHLDSMLERGLIEPTVQPGARRRGRGRPAQAFGLTDAGRARLPHECDDLARGALDFLRSTCGDEAVAQFATERAEALAARLELRMATLPAERDASPAGRLAAALSAEGYAASAHPAAGGQQVCQHHCPVAHVAGHVSELCDAEARAFERLLGTHVQRLATIANGDGICTTFIPERTMNAVPDRSVHDRISTTGGTP